MQVAPELLRECDPEPLLGIHDAEGSSPARRGRNAR
jgi:hypothetical protein